MAVREDAVELYGFDNQDSLEMFMLLTTVSGIGSKAALSILSSLSVQEVRKAVVFDDPNVLVRAQGIGKKSASRIILELKDKLMKETDLGAAAQASIESSAPIATSSGKLSEAQDALMVLGYSRAEAQNALKNIDTQNLGLEEIIKKALKLLM
jgi:Holliday junction DNA helicase RuvA